MDIPAQGAKSLPLGDIIVKGTSVSFRLLAGAGNPGAALTLSDDGARLTGTFTQGGASFALELKRGAVAAAATKRPQQPVRPFPYREEEVSHFSCCPIT
jgi:hypothetical protein